MRWQVRSTLWPRGWPRWTSLAELSTAHGVWSSGRHGLVPCPASQQRGGVTLTRGLQRGRSVAPGAPVNTASYLQGRYKWEFHLNETVLGVIR